MELSQECQSWPSLCLRSWPYASAQDRQTELFTVAAFPDQAEKLLENTSMFKNMPLNIIVSGAHVRSEESCCHRRVRQQHSAPYEFYRKHLNALLRLIHCSFGEQFNILNITQREREREELFSMPSFEKMNPDPLFSSICQFSFSFFIMLSSVASSVHLL